MRLTGFICASLLSSWNIVHFIPFQAPFMIQTADLIKKMNSVLRRGPLPQQSLACHALMKHERRLRLT